MIRRLLFFAALGLTLFGIGIWRLSDGFSIDKMSGSLPYDARWEVESPSTFQVRHILSQPFYYIGKGSQCYVFESADKQYILKFFRLARYRIPSFQQALPLPPFLADIQNKRVEEKYAKQEKLFTSCKLAFDELKEECGLIYLHLNQTTFLTQDIILHDNLKRPLTIPLDKHAFIIQRRVDQVFPYLGQLLREGKTEEVKTALLNLSVLLDKRIEKGICDHDAEIHKNAGFLHGRAIFLDVGQFSKEEETHSQEKAMRKLLLWLESKDAKLAAEAKIILANV